MKRFSLFLFVLSVFFQACTDPEGVDPEPPQRVRMVLKEAGFDTLETERGIDAEPNPLGGPNFIQLMWYRHPEEARLNYFKIYRSENPLGLVNYNLIATTENQQNKLDTLFLDTQELVLNVRYYYYVTAVNEKGTESLPSDTVYYTLIEKATQLSLNNNISVISRDPLNFEWWIDSGQNPDTYILRIERNVSQTFNPLAYVTVIRSRYQNPEMFAMSGNWLKNLLPNGDYRWRIDCVGEDLFSGSESDWMYFKINWSN